MNLHAAAGSPEPRLAGNATLSARAGQFLFIGAITPHDPSTGLVVTSTRQHPQEIRRAQLGRVLLDASVERAVAQAWTIYTTLMGLLAAQGASAADLLRQRLFLTDLRDLPAVERVMDLFLPTPRPATSVVEVPTSGVHPDICLQLDAVALVPQPGGFTKQTIQIPGLESATDGYPQATRAGQLIFISNTVGINLETGKLASSLTELGAEAERFADYRLRTAKEEAILAQSWFTFRNIRTVLESQGAGLGDILKVMGWLEFPMKEFGPLARVREMLFTRPEDMPASASLGISAVAHDGALLSYECVALAPGGDYRKETPLGAADLIPMYVPALGAGPFVFTCGEVPIDVKTPRVITRLEELDPADEGRFLGFGRIHAEDEIQARAWYVYRQNQSYLEAHGASYKDVVHQTVFMVNPADYPSLERVATLFYGPQVPPTTLIPITTTSPYHEAALEIELIAAT